MLLCVHHADSAGTIQLNLVNETMQEKEKLRTRNT